MTAGLRLRAIALAILFPMTAGAVTMPVSRPVGLRLSPEEQADHQLQKETLGARPFSFWRDMKEGGSLLFDKHGMLTLAQGTFIAVGSSFDDDGAREYFAETGRIGNYDRIGNEYLGTGVPGVIVGAVFWGIGYFGSKPFESHVGQAELEAILVTGIASTALKGIVRRSRPNGSDHYSFPSAHTSTVFATATTLAEFYGWKVGVPAFGLGLFTAVSRMSVNEHWLSDTVSGAVLGIWIAQGFARAHLRRYNYYERVAEKEKTTKISFFPVFEPEGAQLVMHISF